VPVEIFTNDASTTVSSGGTDSPAAGTSQSWTVNSSTGFPAAVANATGFHVIDPANPDEVMLVTNVSGTTWTVTRGVEGPVVMHASGFTVIPYLSAAVLSSMVQNGSMGLVTALDSLAAMP
jgi:hypothetical protein